MPISTWSQITAGLPVSVVLKADQRTGHQVQGVVAQVLTRYDHPRGIKVRLRDGRVGRVQRVLGSTLPDSTSGASNTQTTGRSGQTDKESGIFSASTLTTSYSTKSFPVPRQTTPIPQAVTHTSSLEEYIKPSYHKHPKSSLRKKHDPTPQMADHNPWASSTSQGNPYLGGTGGAGGGGNTNPASNPAAGQRDEWQGYQSSPYQYQQQQQQQPSYNTGGDADWSDHQRFYAGDDDHTHYAPPSGAPPQQSSYQPPSSYQPQPPPPQQPNQHQPQSLRRSSTEEFLARESDRGEQFEHMQQFESQARETEDDRNQAQLQKEYPNIDSSLIAALYGDTKSLTETRELLQELSGGK